MRKRTENEELKQALDEINDIDDMLKKEGKSYGERRYRKIMYTSVFLILDSLRIIRTLLCFLIGTLLVHLLIA